MSRKADGTSAGIFLYDLKSALYERLTANGQGASLLSDGRRLLFEDGGKLWFSDSPDRRPVELLAFGPPVGSIYARRFRLSRDEHQLVFVQNAVEGDIWLMSFD